VVLEPPTRIGSPEADEKPPLRGQADVNLLARWSFPLWRSLMEYDHPAKSGIEPVRARPDEPELGRVECELRQRTSGILKVALPPEWMRLLEQLCVPPSPIV
jgi:hypothetical protein